MVAIISKSGIFSCIYVQMVENAEERLLSLWIKAALVVIQA